MKSVYAAGLTRAQAGEKLKAIREMWLDRGCAADFTSPCALEVSDCTNANDEGEYRIRPEDWPLINGEPV